MLDGANHLQISDCCLSQGWGEGEFLSLGAKRAKGSEKRIDREGIKIPTSYKYVINRYKHTLGIINSSKIPPWDHCIHVLATGQGSDGSEGLTQKELKSYTEVNLNNNLEIRGTCMEFREGEKQAGKKK